MQRAWGQCSNRCRVSNKCRVSIKCRGPCSNKCRGCLLEVLRYLCQYVYGNSEWVLTILWICLPIFRVISVGLGFGFPECESKIFPGFRSRCTIPFEFNAFIAHAEQTHEHRQTCRSYCTGTSDWLKIMYEQYYTIHMRVSWEWVSSFLTAKIHYTSFPTASP